MMTASTLANALDDLGNVDNEAAVLNSWAASYTAYMMESLVNGISPLNSSLFASCETAMKSAMVGISASGAGGAKIVAGVKAYWGAVALAFATIWILVPPLITFSVLPTGVLTPGAELAFQGNLEAVFLSNTSGSLSRVDAYAAIASIIHSNSSGAMVIQSTVPTTTTWPVL